MQNEKKTTKYVKYDYIINEMIDDINKSIKNLEAVITGQKELIDYLEKANNIKFTSFIEQLKKSNEQYAEQIKVLQHRLSCVEVIKSMLTDFAEASFILAMLLEAFGVVNKEAKSIEEREKNKEDVEEFSTKYFA